MASYTITKIVISLIAVVVALMIYKIITYYVTKRIKTDKLQRMMKLVKGIFKVIITLITIFALVSIWGFEIQNIWVIISSILAIIAIGFIAVWSLLSNIIAALLIFFSKPFKIGDYILIMQDNAEGKVIEVGSMFTRLVDDKGNEICIPNNILFQKIIKIKRDTK